MSDAWTLEDRVALRAALVRLYVDAASARRVASDAALDVHQIDFAGTSVNRWQAIIDAALNHPGALERLLAVARAEYPQVEALKLLARPRATPVTPAPPSTMLDLQQLPGPDFKRLQDALLEAFPTTSELEQLVRFNLNENLATISASGNLRTDVFALIRWSQAHGRTRDLLVAACSERPGNPALRAIAQRAGLGA